MTPRRPNKRLPGSLLLIALLVAAALASSSLAATGSYLGSISTAADSSVEFVVKRSERSGKRVVRVRQIAVGGLPVSCSDGTEGRVDVNADSSALVAKRRFRFSGGSQSRTFIFRGALQAGGTGSGKLRLSGLLKIEGSTRSCDSGTLQWSASR